MNNCLGNNKQAKQAKQVKQVSQVNQVNQTTHTNRGFTLIELMISLTIIIMVMAIAIPNYQRAGEKAQLSGCEGNQKVIIAQLESYYLHNNNYPLIDINEFGKQIGSYDSKYNKDFVEFLASIDLNEQVKGSENYIHHAYNEISNSNDPVNKWYPLDMGKLKDDGYLQDVVKCPKGGFYLVKFNSKGKVSDVMCSIDDNL